MMSDEEVQKYARKSAILIGRELKPIAGADWLLKLKNALLPLISGQCLAALEDFYEKKRILYMNILHI